MAYVKKFYVVNNPKYICFLCKKFEGYCLRVLHAKYSFFYLKKSNSANTHIQLETFAKNCIMQVVLEIEA